MKFYKVLLLGIGILCGGMWSIAPRACNIPVFRYALERWPADNYNGMVFSKGPLTAAQKALLAALNADNAQSARVCNLAVDMTDVTGAMPDEWASLPHDLHMHSFPYLVIRYPQHFLTNTVAWQGPLTAASVKALRSSPAREQIAAHIAHGDAAVFVVLQTGNAKKDLAADKLLRKSLAKASTTVTPDAAPAPPGPTNEDSDGQPQGNVPIHYSLLTIAPGDAREQVFLTLLRGAASRLGDMKGVIVCPFFGQGRVLCSLADAQITDDNIQDVSHFLSGNCSCQVKDANPGIDMLFNADWSAMNTADAQTTPPLVSLASLPPDPTPSKPARRTPADTAAPAKPVHPVPVSAIAPPKVPGNAQAKTLVSIFHPASITPPPPAPAPAPAAEAAAALPAISTPPPALWRNTIVFIGIALLLSMLLSLLLMRNGLHSRRH